MSKYKEIMDRVEVTPDMYARIVNNAAETKKAPGWNWKPLIGIAAAAMALIVVLPRMPLGSPAASMSDYSSEETMPVTSKGVDVQGESVYGFAAEASEGEDVWCNEDVCVAVEETGNKGSDTISIPAQANSSGISEETDLVYNGIHYHLSAYSRNDQPFGGFTGEEWNAVAEELLGRPSE